MFNSLTHRKTIPMITFKYPSDITKLPRNDPAYLLVREYLLRLMVTADDSCQCWCPESQGFIVQLEESDTSRNLMPVWQDQFKDIPFESVHYQDGFYIAVVILNNNFGLIWLVEDAPWIDGPIRDVLKRNMDT
ncbi:MAG: hypothetical protein HOM14_06730 [Gammaproteobacteria bacterium]|nr:hypothetical protein [Gammaproteobacteria bacterium]MBT3725409.1 hypothetical protein [Gammaproteobacteria bacterium]MBT4193980.1 hypothetical protein [Gammaproteobacteria bacterium]MBT4448357.1 hypothetical protein [Gammaproteobacteria bacterium]MBT4862885.1 hypothetical protein [Gammaproteobacteria bacterium]